tara:strand:+ start:309 stop:650 length:342 start_codon:yes stop_codon:yes gene_type:complete
MKTPKLYLRIDNYILYIMNETDNLQVLRNKIEKLDKVHHIGILKILKENTVQYSENSNGIFLNLTNVNDVIINLINKYVKYVNLQEDELGDIEDKKQEYKNEFYNDNKELSLY